jgi:hypothetical protein
MDAVDFGEVVHFTCTQELPAVPAAKSNLMRMAVGICRMCRSRGSEAGCNQEAGKCELDLHGSSPSGTPVARFALGLVDHRRENAALKLKAAGTRRSARVHRLDEKPQKKAPPDLSGGADVFRQM